MTVPSMVPSGSFSLTEAGNDPFSPFLDTISPDIDLHPLPCLPVLCEVRISLLYHWPSRAWTGKEGKRKGKEGKWDREARFIHRGEERGRKG